MKFRTGVDGNRTHLGPDSDPTTVLKTAAATRRAVTPRLSVRLCRTFHFETIVRVRADSDVGAGPDLLIPVSGRARTYVWFITPAIASASASSWSVITVRKSKSKAS